MFPSGVSYAGRSHDVSNAATKFPRLFWRWFQALWLAHRKGAESLFEDFCARVEALREAETPRAPREWFAQVASCARAHGEVLAAAAERRDAAAIRRAVSTSIAEQRELILLLDRAEGVRKVA